MWRCLFSLSSRVRVSVALNQNDRPSSSRYYSLDFIVEYMCILDHFWGIQLGFDHQDTYPFYLTTYFQDNPVVLCLALTATVQTPPNSPFIPSFPVPCLMTRACSIARLLLGDYTSFDFLHFDYTLHFHLCPYFQHGLLKPFDRYEHIYMRMCADFFRSLSTADCKIGLFQLWLENLCFQETLQLYRLQPSQEEKAKGRTSS